VERADRVVVISHGSVVEQGTHAELVRRTDGLYAKLVQRQMLGVEIGVDDIDPTVSSVETLTSRTAGSSATTMMHVVEGQQGRRAVSIDSDLPLVSTSPKGGGGSKYGSIA